MFSAAFREKIRERKGKHKRIARYMWALAVLALLGIVFLFVYLSYQDLPTFVELEDPRSNMASEVYAHDGDLLGRYYYENRIPIDYDQINPEIIDALIATEDARFHSHAGIDAEALGRVFVRTVLMGQRSSGGGSTITQQLAKLLYSSRNFSGMNKFEKATSLVSRKLKEWITAVKLERSYTKEEIIAMYLNQFDFIYGAYGIEAAAETYFDKTQDSLRTEEAATLVGMLKNPALFNPNRFPDTTMHRRMVVLRNMLDKDYIDRVTYDSLRQLPLGIQLTKQDHVTGTANYFRMNLRDELKELIKQENLRKPDGEMYNPYADGLRVYTTLDIGMQKHLEAAVAEHMPVLQKRFWRRWKNKDPWTFKDAETTEENLRARRLTLTRLIRDSDRYKSLREKRLSNIIALLKKETDYELRDFDIDRMLEADEGDLKLVKLLERKLITQERLGIYKKVMRSIHWKELVTRWDKLQKEVKEAFDKPVEMRIFDYESKGLERDTLMSPLDSIKYLRNHLQVGSMAMDPLTGEIRAWVGGINFKWFQYDHVTTDRQVGSTFKPFVYATAIEMQGVSPCYEVRDVPYTINVGEGRFSLIKEWTPANANGKYSYEIFSLKEGLRKSKNTISVFLMKQLGDAAPVKQLASNMGLTEDKIPAVPSIALGSADLSVYEMTAAYGTFANNGLRNEPTFIQRIEDRNGRVIYQSRPEEFKALNPETNYVMVEMLKYASGGMGFKSEVGGKTGTTNDYVDGWFMGITPNLVVGTWVGGEHNWIRFRTLENGQGAVMAKPVFRKFLKLVEADESLDFDENRRFHRPSNALNIELDCSLYQSRYPATDTGEEGNENFGDNPFADEITNDPEYTPKGIEDDDF